ncbi:MAG: putative damage-inducible protein DinB [Flavobacteriales bacterium]|jgi:uncharacterized damage-inducible protein DinB
MPHTALEQNISVLNQLSFFLDLCSKDDYIKLSPYSESSIGGHVRHILDHYLVFKQSLESGDIIYGNRPRNPQLEDEPSIANELSQSIVQSLRTMTTRSGDEALLIRDQEHDTKLNSSLSRELLFLSGHSTHHMAIIKIFFQSYGHKLPADFGVAPSTLTYQAEQNKTCAH